MNKSKKQEVIFLVPGDKQHKLLLAMLRDYQMQDMVTAYLKLSDEKKAELAQIAEEMTA